MMEGRYRSLFVIPQGAARTLGESGWEFSSNRRIPQAIGHAVISSLHLAKTDSFLGMEEYCGSNVKLTMMLDGTGSIEHMFVRAYGLRDVHEELLRILEHFVKMGEVELFVPN